MVKTGLLAPFLRFWQVLRVNCTVCTWEAYGLYGSVPLRDHCAVERGRDLRDSVFVDHAEAPCPIGKRESGIGDAVAPQGAEQRPQG